MPVQESEIDVLKRVVGVTQCVSENGVPPQSSGQINVTSSQAMIQVCRQVSVKAWDLFSIILQAFDDQATHQVEIFG